MLEFFTEIKRKFYVDSEDPGEEKFYESICEKFGVSYEKFLERFKSEAVRKETRDEFMLNRNWGVRGYPCLVLRKGERLLSVANGFATYEQIVEQVDRFLQEDLAGQNAE